MMYQQIKHLQENGIPLKQIVYVNFEDERLLETVSGRFECYFGNWIGNGWVDNRPYLFLDEIQNT